MPTDFGSDIAFAIGPTGVLDLDVTGATVSGLTALGQSLARRFATPPGSLPWAPGEGMDLRAYLNASLDRADVSRLRMAIVSEALRDERVLGVTADVLFDYAAKTMQVRLEIDTALGPFRLVLGIDAVTVSILSATE